MPTGCAPPSKATWRPGACRRWTAREPARIAWWVTPSVHDKNSTTTTAEGALVGGGGPGWGVGVGYGWGRGRGYGGWGYDGPWVQDETRIAIDVFDARAHKAIWHGAVSQNASDLRGANAEAKINAAASAIFSKLPIGTAPPPPPSGKVSS